MTNHKWGKEFSIAKHQHRQTCTVCGIVRGVRYTATGKVYYGLAGLGMWPKVPSCTGAK